MIEHEVFNGLRWFNAFAFLLLTVLYVQRVRQVWAAQTVGLKRFMVALVILFIVAAYGSAESYVLEAGTGWRIPAVTLALLGLLHGLWSSRHDGHG